MILEVTSLLKDVTPLTGQGRPNLAHLDINDQVYFEFE